MIWFVGLACAIAIGWSLISPQTFRAQATLLPEESRGFSLASMINEQAGLNLVAGAARREGMIYVEMMKSRSAAESVVRQCDLIRRFRRDHLSEAEQMERTILDLKKRVKLDLSEGGMLIIEVGISTPFLSDSEDRREAASLAASIANAYTDALNTINEEKSTSRARAVRLYLESQIAHTDSLLKAESDSLVHLQLANRTISIEDQTRAAIQTAGDLKGRIIATEIELSILQKSMTPDNPQYRALQTKLGELRKQYARMEYGSGAGSEGEAPGPDLTGGTDPLARLKNEDSRDFQLVFAELPVAAQQQAALMRDLRVLQTVYELLNEQYYRARIQEEGDIPSLATLDRAEAPVYRSWPKRGIIVLTTFVISLVLAAIAALTLEYRDRRLGIPVPEDPIDPRGALRRDFAQLRGRLTRPARS